VLDRVVAGIALGAAAAGFFIARGIDDPWWLVAAAFLGDLHRLDGSHVSTDSAR